MVFSEWNAKTLKNIQVPNRHFILLPRVFSWQQNKVSLWLWKYNSLGASKKEEKAGDFQLGG